MVDEHVQAEALARAQLDDIKDTPYQSSGVYAVTVDRPPGYSMSIDVQTLDTDTCAADGNCNTLHEITVSISADDSPVSSVTYYKANR